MSNSLYNNRTLLIVFLSLSGLWLFLRVIGGGASPANYRTILVTSDTSAITAIYLYPKSENQQEIRLFKQGNDWKVSRGSITAMTGAGMVQNLLDQLVAIRPKRLAAKSRDKWEEFQLTDSLATRVKVEEGEGNLTLDLMIGRFSFKQQPGGMNQFQQQQQKPQSTSYVRLYEEDEVYAVDGFLTMTFNQRFNSWRNNTFVKTEQALLSQINFRKPGDQGFSIQKVGNKWTIGDTPADSAKMVQYLSSLSNLAGSEYADNFNPTGMPQYELSLSGDNMPPTKVQAWSGTQPNEVILNSTLNPQSYFKSKMDAGIFEKLFKPAYYFLPELEETPQ